MHTYIFTHTCIHTYLITKFHAPSIIKSHILKLFKFVNTLLIIQYHFPGGVVTDFSGSELP